MRNPYCLDGTTIFDFPTDGSSCDSGNRIVDTVNNLNTNSVTYDMDDVGSASENSTGLTNLINSFSYFNSNPSALLDVCTLDRTIAVTVEDNGTPVDTGQFIVNLSAVPYGSFTGSNVVLYTENTSATSVIGLTDALQLCAKDGASTALSDNLLSATITVTDSTGSQNIADNLAITTSGSISLDGASTATNLILTGTDLEASYKTVFETLTFESSEITPTGTPSARTISLTITDTTGTSAAFTKDITVTGVNDPTDPYW